MNKAIDEVRASEARALKRGRQPVLKHARWCLLKRRENLTDQPAVALGVAEAEPQGGAGLPAAGGLPGVLGVPPVLGRSVPEEWTTRTCGRGSSR